MQKKKKVFALTISDARLFTYQCDLYFGIATTTFFFFFVNPIELQSMSAIN
jgi:hypothetical protein